MADHGATINQPPSGAEGHHQVHHCGKCGWPFPKPHPSAKHRRAHRRICGAIEGYRLDESQHSNVSDDEHSDDDYKTPSARALERSESGIGSGRSDDEVFSDAPLNFTDSVASSIPEAARVTVLETESIIEMVKEDIPGHATTEFRQADNFTERAEHQDKSVQEISSDDLFEDNLSAADHFSSSAVGAHVESVQESAPSKVEQKNDQADDFVISEPKPDENVAVVPESTVEVFESKLGALGQLLSSPMDTLVESPKESSASTIRHDNVPADDSVLIEPKPFVGLNSEAKKPNEDFVAPKSTGVVFVEDSTAAIKQENDPTDDSIEPKHPVSTISEVKQPDEDIAVTKHMSESVSRDMEAKAVDEPATLFHNDTLLTESPEAVAKLGTEETTVQIPQEAVKIIEETNQSSIDDNIAIGTFEKIPKVEGTYNIDALSELCSEEKAPKLASLSGDASTAESNIDQGMEVLTSGDGINEIKEPEDHKFTVFSVPDGVPQVDYPERVIEGFKDYNRMGWFNPDNCGPSEGIPKDDVAIASPGSQAGAVKESPEVTSGFQESKVPSESVEKSKPVDEEPLFEGNPVSHHVNAEVANSEICEDDNGVVSRVLNASSEMVFSGRGLDELDKAKIAYAAGDLAEKRFEEVPESASVVEKFQMSQEDVNSERVTVEDLSQNAVLPGSTLNLLPVPDSLNAEPIIDQLTLTQEKQEKDDKDPTELAGHVQKSGEADSENDGCSAVLMQGQDIVPHIVSVPHNYLGKDEMAIKDKEMQFSSEDCLVDATSGSLHTASLVPASGETEVGVDYVGGTQCVPLQHEGDTNHVKTVMTGPTIDASADSRSTDSLDANWGSVSETVMSTQSDALAAVDDSKATSEAGKSTSKLPKLDSNISRGSDKSETFEPPSFMTLVEPAGNREKTTASSNQGQPGWFPSLTNVSTDSPGRKKNEEIIAKVTNWSSNQQQHSPLKSLLIEANRDAKPKSPNPKAGVPIEAQEEKSMTVGSMLGSENQKSDDEKQAAAAQQWNSPARYPSEIKREKRKVKGRPIWAQFVCCSSSVN